MKAARFHVDGVAYAVAAGRERPGLPSWHVIRVSDEKHISLAFPETEKTVLFDMGAGRGFRVDLEQGTAAELSRAAYYRAREACGYAVRRRKKAVPV